MEKQSHIGESVLVLFLLRLLRPVADTLDVLVPEPFWGVSMSVAGPPELTANEKNACSRHKEV
jgi:hypothetical protein